MIDKPFSQACENNKGPILKILLEAFANTNRVLEIGSGTGQHAVHFAANLPHLNWHTADQEDYLDGINAWIDEFPSENLHRPVKLSLPNDPWPIVNAAVEDNEKANFDAYFTANTAHIMQKYQVQYMMKQVNRRLPSRGVFCQYGPFTIDFKFSSESNADFHQKLLESGRGGYRDISELENWAPDLTLANIVNMPANNLMLIWYKRL